MTEVVSIRFNCRGKKYFFEPNGVETKEGDTVIVETAKGLDVGKVAIGNHMVPDESLIPPLRPVIRIATEDDFRIIALNKEREEEAFGICKQKIADHGLEMKLIDVECSFEGNKILFFFTADGRVDFRELVKDLASVFHTRIELRQIGVRDETKMLGGIGICGRPYCCAGFLTDFQPVSTKMAKTQSISLNPAKISGACGRLMCCLRYEQEAYEELVKTIPKNGAFVQTIDGYGVVVQSNILRQRVKVKLDSDKEQEIKEFTVEQIAVIPGGRPPHGEPLPDILEYVEKPEEKLEEEDPWAAPNLFAFEEEERKPREKHQNPRNRRPKQDNQNRQNNKGGKPKPKNGKPDNQGGKPNNNRQKPNRDDKDKPANQNGGQQKSGNQQKGNQQKNSNPNQKNGGQNRKNGGNPNYRRRNNKPKNQKQQGDAPKNQNQQKQGDATKQNKPKSNSPKPANAAKPKE